MAKRRTRKEKVQAKHNYTNTYSFSEVGEQNYRGAVTKTETTTVISPSYLYTDTPLIKKDIVKSVIISGLILLVEFLIYWKWYK